jgi:thiopurine S-methyltransferase
MEHEFWHDRWENDRIGFHQQTTNPYLIENINVLKNSPNRCIFVPLCGKTKDILWLSEIGFHVIGVEINKKAIISFFTENNLDYSTKEDANITCFSSVNITIYKGDIFDLKPKHMNNADCFYDRAALIALPKNMRNNYTQQIKALTGNSPIGLLVSIEYLPTQSEFPPFCIKEDEITRLFSNSFKIKKLMEKDILDSSPKAIERGLTEIKEVAYSLTSLCR